MSHYFILLLLTLLGLVTGFIGTNTGGSVLITVPIMVSLGISPQAAIASSRLASVGTMLGGLRQFHKNKKIDYKLAVPASIFGIMGALIGAHILLIVPEAILKKIIGVLIIALLLLSLVKAKSNVIKNYATELSAKRKWTGYLLFVIVGAVGGFFGCQSKLATFIFQLIFRKSISESVGTRKVSGLVVVITSLFIYGVHGIINWSFGLALILGTLIGSTFGASYGLKKGDQWMQNLFSIIVAALGLAMLMGY